MSLDKEIKTTVVRSMKSDEFGLPKKGACARTLGARRPEDIEENDSSLVEPNTGGVSASPLPVENLPPFRRPVEFGGTGKDFVWKIDTTVLHEYDLYYYPDPDDPDRHGFIAPRYQMTYEKYQESLHSTQTEWELIKNEE